MLTQGDGAARLIGGQTAKTLAQGFITLQTAGVREFADQLERIAAEVGKDASGDFKRAVKAGAEIIKRSYVDRVSDVTGGLKKSVKVKTKNYSKATVAIVGPAQTGNVGSTDTQASGNHAWLYEFGSGRRAPGTRGRRTYLNVHQMINGKMSRHSSANNEQFARMSRGYYFLMGSINEPTRQARMGSGYPHDFGQTGGKMHPITLHPGETYRGMPARHPMEKTINAEQQAVFNVLKQSIQNSIARLSS